MALREAATESAQNDDPTVAKVLKLHELQVGFEGFFGLNLVSPRGLLSSFLKNLVQKTVANLRQFFGLSNRQTKIISSMIFLFSHIRYT